MTSRTIVLTGGGTAGHVMVNLAILPSLKEAGWNPVYIGSHGGIEKKLVSGQMPYHGISSGKLRRYFDFKNFTDIFRVLTGILQSFVLLRKISPNIIFSKGGFVSVPVVIAGWLLKIPVVAHEADITPGLANKIALNFTTHMCLAFEETAKYIKSRAYTVTGIPVRAEVLKGSKEAGLKISGLKNNKPVILVMGGSSGAKSINNFIRSILNDILEENQVIHLTGTGNIDTGINPEGYFQCEFLGDDLRDIYAITDVVVSRAGANSIFELFALNLPHILIPLPLGASRGDQIENAKSLEKSGYSQVLYEEDLSRERFLQSLKHIKNSLEQIKQQMEKSPLKYHTLDILNVIEANSR